MLLLAMPKPRYWTSEKQITDAIDRRTAAANSYLKMAGEAHDKMQLALNESVSPALAKSSQLDAIVVAKFEKRLWELYIARGNRIYNKELPRLKRKLAEFRTDLLPGSGVDDRRVRR